MKSLPRLRITTMMLMAVNLILLVVTIGVWRSGQSRIHEPEHIAVRRLALPDLVASSGNSAPKTDVSVIREDAVFYSRRLYYRPPAPAEVIAAPEYDLAGIMSLPQGRAIAFLKKKSDQSSLSVHAGDDVDGWRVATIDNSHVVLTRDRQRIELTAAVSTSAPGLVRGNFNPPATQSGLRVFGGQQARTYPLTQPGLSVVRTYRPPPSH